MAANLMSANRQWANRAADERFQSIPDMMAVANKRKKATFETNITTKGLAFKPTSDNDIELSDANGNALDFTNYSFGQFATKLGCPAKFLSEKLSANTTALVLNERMTDLENEQAIQCLINVNEGDKSVLRSVTSESYARFYDADILPYLLKMERAGWTNPVSAPRFGNEPNIRIATQEDVAKYGGKGGCQIQVGSQIVNSGLFMSDRDMFVLMIYKDSATDDGFGNPLMRGIIIRNSEVGDSVFSIQTFILQGVCLNLILWGVTNLVMEKYRHTGAASGRIFNALNNLVNTQAPKFDKELQVIKAMAGLRLGNNSGDVADKLYALDLPGLTQKFIAAALGNAAKFRAVDGDPYTLYGATNAITRFSQTVPNMNNRLIIDNSVAAIYEKANRELVGV